MKPPRKLSSVILWSVISAAFIGPGTVTTAVTAGSQFQLQLLWSVVFSTVGCIVLQEISARIAITSGLTFGQSLTRKFGNRTGTNLQWIVGGSVILGCAAYEAGNILGAVAGLELITGLQREVLTVLITAVAGFVLWVGGKNWIGNLMTALVLLMGIAFFALAASQHTSTSALLAASVIPVIPPDSEWIVLGLVGTTIVPYNIFIGAGISKGETLSLMRIGLTISVVIGGLITAAILIAGLSVPSFSSFQELAGIMSAQVGSWGGWALAIGLFAAGFSSAITSPYASALIVSTVFGAEKKSSARGVWLAVLLTGFAFGISGVKPIPVILAVQAINGLVLPLLTLYLILIANDSTIVPSAERPGIAYNVVLLVVLTTVLLIGLNNIDKSINQTLEWKEPHFYLVLVGTLATVAYAATRIFSSKA